MFTHALEVDSSEEMSSRAVKLRRPTARRLAIAVTAVFLLGFAPTSGASDRDPEGAQVSLERRADDRSGNPAATFLAGERGIAPADAAERISMQERVLGELNQASVESRPWFGGIWIGEDDRVVVGVRSRMDSSKVRTTLRDLAPRASVQPVKHSWSDLVAANQTITSWMRDLPVAESRTLAVSLLPTENSVLVKTSDSPTSAVEALVSKAQAEFPGAVQIRRGFEPIQDYGCQISPPMDASGPYCDPPLRAGIQIDNSGRCSGGFLARSIYDAKLYVLTAGHCGSGTWRSDFSDGSTHVIGDMWSRHMGAFGDFGIIRVNNEPGWAARAWAIVLNGPWTTQNLGYKISAEGSSVVGMPICKTGAATDTSCGFVTEVGASSGAIGNLGVAGLEALPGDSGAPLFKANTAYGLLMGGTAPYPTTYYSSVNAAEAILNVEISNES
ncbi:MAG: S1 family peptidase [Microthrixaceae bacterium]